jgi:penicillin-binding protein 2
MIVLHLKASSAVRFTELQVLHDNRFAGSRIAMVRYTGFAIFLLLLARFWQLQIQNPQFYDELAQANSIKFVPIPAPRGRILDRDGRVLVDNHASFQLILARPTLREDHLRTIAHGLDLDYTDLAARIGHFKSEPEYVPVVIKDELTPADLAFLDSHRELLAELVLMPAQRRRYPQNGTLSHVIGYTGEISDGELDTLTFAKYDPRDLIGKSGIERQYNDTLMGVEGQRQLLVDSRGQVRQVIGDQAAVPGKDIQLTIDLDLQAVAESAMDGRTGAVVALDPRTGEVLAMVSRPTFDANSFAGRMKTEDWKEIADNPDHPLLNRAIQAQQAPGSTFKPFVALAGLETGTINDDFTVRCSGGINLYGRYQHCWARTGHGPISLHNGIVQSCDVYFYVLGSKLGIDNIAKYAKIAGMGESTGIDLPHEGVGIVPSPEWKLRSFQQQWSDGETPSVAIGQGALTVTPLQLARAIGGVAMGGIWHHPHLRKALDVEEQPDVWKLNPANVHKVVDGMYGVVNEDHGTGRRARLADIDVCGKTGSAQLASNGYLKSIAADGNLKDNAWFEGFAPCYAPEIVVVALLEHGEHGQFAAPIVRDVMKAYFVKKAGMPAPAPQGQ